MRVFPGFPLTLDDYAPLIRELQAAGVPANVALAHSLGCLDALREVPEGEPLVLMAPSDPARRRPARRVQALVLAALGSLPVGARPLARMLRTRSFAAFGVDAPPGSPLTLSDAASRLRSPRTTATPRSGVTVLFSTDDPRYTEQLDLAQRLGAAAVAVSGGHLFPIIRPSDTAHTLAAIL